MAKNYNSKQYVRFDFRIKDNTKKYSKAFQTAAERAILQGLEDVLFVSKQLVPYDTGALQKTGRIEKKGNTYSVVYGSPSVRYAYPQHEIPYFHDNGREWKYVETPFNEMQSGLDRRIANEINYEIKRSIR